MKSGLLVLGVIMLAVVLGLGWAVSVNNRLVGRDQTVQESLEREGRAAPARSHGPA